MARRSSSTSKPKPAAKAPRKKRPAPIQGLSASDVAGGAQPAEVDALCREIRESGGGVIGSYRDPVGGHWQVVAAVAGLKERGFTSPYLKAFVVARINPLRFRRGATMSAAAALDAMTAAAARFDPDKVKPGDLASAPAGPPDE